MDRALEISPDSSAAQFYIALVNLAADDVESANAEISRAVDAFPTLSNDEQELIYTRVVSGLDAFAQENPDSAAEVGAMIEVIPELQ